MPRRVGFLLGILVLFGASSAHSGNLRASIYPPPPAVAPGNAPPVTPPTAWEIPQPLLRAPSPTPRSLPRDLMAILIPQKNQRGRSREVEVELKKGRARPSIAEAAPGARVSFAARESVAIKFTFGESLVASRRGTVMRFDEPGLYSFVGEDDPGLWGHVAVGSDVKLQKVPASGDLVVRDLAPGPWEVFLVSGRDARSAGTVTLFGEGEETPCSFEYAP